MEDDRKWILGGGGCVAAGLIVSIITRSWTWFAVGATTGAVIVGGRLYYKSTAPSSSSSETDPVVPEDIDDEEDSLAHAHYPQAKYGTRAVKVTDMLGAPLIDSGDTRPANKPRLLSRAETSGYPMRHRIPECDAFALPMDPRGYSGLVDEIRRVW